MSIFINGNFFAFCNNLSAYGADYLASPTSGLAGRRNVFYCFFLVSKSRCRKFIFVGYEFFFITYRAGLQNAGCMRAVRFDNLLYPLVSKRFAVFYYLQFALYAFAYRADLTVHCGLGAGSINKGFYIVMLAGRGNYDALLFQFAQCADAIHLAIFGAGRGLLDVLYPCMLVRNGAVAHFFIAQLAYHLADTVSAGFAIALFENGRYNRLMRRCINVYFIALINHITASFANNLAAPALSLAGSRYIVYFNRRMLLLGFITVAAFIKRNKLYFFAALTSPLNAGRVFAAGIQNLFVPLMSKSFTAFNSSHFTVGPSAFGANFAVHLRFFTGCINEIHLKLVAKLIYILNFSAFSALILVNTCSLTSAFTKSSNCMPIMFTVCNFTHCRTHGANHTYGHQECPYALRSFIHTFCSSFLKIDLFQCHHQASVPFSSKHR